MVPPTIKLFALLFHNYTFATVMNHNINILETVYIYLSISMANSWIFCGIINNKFGLSFVLGLDNKARSHDLALAGLELRDPLPPKPRTKGMSLR